jgi:methyl-accepting chemotaxis protein
MKKKKRISISMKLTAMVIVPVLILGTGLSVMAQEKIKSAISEEIFRNLQTAAAGCVYTAQMEGLEESDSQQILTDYCEAVKEQAEVDVTIFKADTIYATSIRDESGKAIVGTKASDEVIAAVIDEGETYSSKDVTINGEQYYGWYLPITDSAEKVIGIAFAGHSAAYLSQTTSKTANSMTVISTIMFLAVIASGTLLSQRVGKIIQKSVGYVKTLSEGTLDVEVDEKICSRRDDLGELNQAIVKLKQTLKGIISNISDYTLMLVANSEELNSMSDSYSQAANQIATAMDELGHSIVDLSDEVQHSNEETDNIGSGISDIAGNVAQLESAMQNTKTASQTARETVVSLSEANNASVEAVDNIVHQINVTSDAVSSIIGITAALNDITSQVNLLSLNASIEAARAGDAGRGFAVVADEIRNLADQSAASTADIMNIIDKLTEEAEKTIKLSNEVKAAITNEHTSLKNTDESFGVIQQNIETIGNALNQVNSKTIALDSSKISVVDSMSNLSAISEENAASAQEVTAGCEEMTANSTMLHTKAEEIKELAEKLTDALKFFQL